MTGSGFPVYDTSFASGRAKLPGWTPRSSKADADSTLTEAPVSNLKFMILPLTSNLVNQDSPTLLPSIEPTNNKSSESCSNSKVPIFFFFEILVYFYIQKKND